MTHDQKKSEEKGKALHDEREALKQRARDLQERQNPHKGPNDPGGDQVPRPAPDDPRYGRPSTQANQANVPTGNTTGSAMGGSAKRKKDHAG